MIQPISTPVSASCRLQHTWRTVSISANPPKRCARFLPLPVVINGQPAQRGNFLAGCHAVTVHDGIRIGATRAESRWRYGNYNFHGVTASGPKVTLQGRRPDGSYDHQWTCYFDTTREGSIDLVLPARRAVRETAETNALKRAATVFLWETVLAAEPELEFDFPIYQKAQLLGIRGPRVPQPRLRHWTPCTADDDCGGSQTGCGPRVDIQPETDDASGPVLLCLSGSERLEAPDQVVLYRALMRAGCAEQVYEPDDTLIGYDWYNNLNRVEEIRIEVQQGETTHQVWNLREGGKLPEGAVESGTIILDLTRGQMRIPTDLVFIHDTYDGDDPDIIITADSDLGVGELSDLIFDGYYSPSTDIEDDSIDTQKRTFLRNAWRTATAALGSPELARKSAIESKATDAIGFDLKAGESVTVSRLPDKTLVAAFAAGQAEAADTGAGGPSEHLR